MKAILLFCLLSVAAGCTGEAWYVDSRFSAEEEDQIQAAADSWAAVGAPPIDLVWRRKVDLTSTGKVIVKASHRAACNYDPGFEDWFGLHAIGIGYERIIVNTEMTPPDLFQGVVAHEFGHHFDLAHTDEEESVMHTPEHPAGPTARDVAALRAEGY